MSRYSLAKIWNAPVRKKRPPFWSVKSWQKNRKRDRKLKMIDRIMRAWTAWIQTEKQKAFQNISAFTYSWIHLGQIELCRNKNIRSWEGDGHLKWTRIGIKWVLFSFLICYSRSITAELHFYIGVQLEICIIDKDRGESAKNNTNYQFIMNSSCCQ